MSRQRPLKTILMDEKLLETTNLGVEITNSKRQARGNLARTYKFSFAI